VVLRRNVFMAITRLSQKFFFEFSEEDFPGEEDPLVIDERQRRRRAINLRILALHGDGSGGTLASTWSAFYFNNGWPRFDIMKPGNPFLPSSWVPILLPNPLSRRSPEVCES
jgi:hypothetical protein